MGDNTPFVIFPRQVVHPEAAVYNLEAEPAVLERLVIVVAMLILVRRDLVHKIL